MIEYWYQKENSFIGDCILNKRRYSLNFIPVYFCRVHSFPNKLYTLYVLFVAPRFMYVIPDNVISCVRDKPSVSRKKE